MNESKWSRCENPRCGKRYFKRMPWGKYCSDKCRMEGWVFNKARLLLGDGKKDLTNNIY